MAGMKMKGFFAKHDYDTSIECTECGAAITFNTFYPVSKDKIRCPYCKAVFTPKKKDLG
jgi:hypothetical protein